MQPSRFAFALVSFAAVAFAVRAETPAAAPVQPAPSILPAETSAQTAARLAWWRDSRFGMFIHWGPVSLNGTEIGWSRGRDLPREQYDRLYTRFDPRAFNADQWAWKPAKSLASTRRGHTIYLHVLENTTGTVQLTALPVTSDTANGVSTHHRI